ncbi:PXA domain-containing protein, partial [Usnea florida]
RDLTTRALDFLSNASNETLGACIIGLGALTWMVLGRVGLVLIGVVGGVVLHATWEGGLQNNAYDDARASEARKKREKGLDVAMRVLDWKRRREESRELDGLRDMPVKPQKELDFDGFPPETKDALTSLVNSIIRDYVKWWYTPVLPLENAFPLACQQTLTGFLLAVSTHLSRKRPADTFLEFVTNSSSIVIVFLSELASAFKSPASSSSASESVRNYLESNPSSSLANVLDVEQQNRKLRAVAQDILNTFLDQKVYGCEPVMVFLREILANVILDMTVTSCSRPEFINGWIIYALEEGDPELLQAIDAGVGGATANGNLKDSVHAAKDEPSPNQIKSSDLLDTRTQAKTEHKRTVSRAEEAMDEAMQEAQRLSELIAAEDAKDKEASEESLSSEETTDAIATPTSSRDDLSAMANSSSSAHVIDDGTSKEFESKVSQSVPSFTTFDQIISSQQPTALRSSETRSYEVPPLTLYNASVSIFDDSVPGEKGNLRSKPTAEYLLQIEPATSQYPGWMIARIYSDFETLHEVLRRISVISGIAAFAERHPTVPAWKNKTKSTLRSELEAYLRSALSFQRLAESEGMKRFLEKDQGLGRSSPTAKQGGFGFPTPAAFETMGKGMLDVLAGAPKGAAGGGKALFGGVTGVLGGVGSLGQRKQNSKSPIPRSVNGSTSVLPQMDSDLSTRSNLAQERELQEDSRSLLNAQTEYMNQPPLPQRPSQPVPDHQTDLKPHTPIPENRELLENVHKERTAAFSQYNEQDQIHLPPPPSEIADDYDLSRGSSRPSVSNDESSNSRTSTSTAPTTSQSRKSTLSSVTPDEPPAPPSKQPPPNRTAPPPLTTQETSIAVELFFATINELYALSSAWTLRLTLLNAAKSFLLRPGNPNLEAIRALLQTTLIDATTSDTAIATHLAKLRENALPTEDELKAWPAPPTEEAKERMRIKARKLLVEKGMPQALTSVMGAAASGEALGRVFDCLQVPEVARGLVFALVLQGVKAVT